MSRSNIPGDCLAEVLELQRQLTATGNRFRDLAAQGISGGPEWDQIRQDAAPLRGRLHELTGDYEGRPKHKLIRPSDELLDAEYFSPEDVPLEVRLWVLKHASLLTSDATDAVRWSRIVGTLNDERYSEGAITVYRAVADGQDIRPGDWVTTDRMYAQMHLERHLLGGGKILESVVDGLDVLVSPTGNDEEAIYAPRQLSGPIEDALRRREAPRS